MTDQQKQILRRLSISINRHEGQLIELFNLCNKDLFKLIELEEKIKNNHIAYCPGNAEEVEKILAMPEKDNWFRIVFFSEMIVYGQKSYEPSQMFKTVGTFSL